MVDFEVYMSSISAWCKRFRVGILNITLKTAENRCGVAMGTLSAFENGRSSNINHIGAYFAMCKHEKHKKMFIRGLELVLRMEDEGM